MQFARAVEMKQVAEQEAERAKFVVMKAEQVRAMDGRHHHPSSSHASLALA